MKIFLDMDGVIVDFFTACLCVHGMDHIWNYENWPDISKMNNVMGLTKEEYWAPIDNDFWENKVQFYDHASDLLLRLKKFDVCLLTSPSRGCASGKQEFIRKYLPEFYKLGKYLIGPAKEFCASPDSLLIDDMEANINKFRNYGGHGILFPQPWNREREYGYKDFISWLDNMVKTLEIIGL